MNTVALGDIVDFHSGGTPSKSNAEFWQGDVPWFSAKDMKRSRLTDSADHISESVFAKTSLRKLPAGTIAMVVRGMILAHTVPISVLDVEAAINQDLKALLPKREVDTSYLAAMLRAQHGEILSQVSTAAHGTKKLESRVLENLQIPLPPLPEQRRIAAILDHADTLRAKRRQVLTHLDTLIASVFDGFFQQRPDGWANLIDLAERVVVGHVGPTSDFLRPTGVPFVRTGNVGRGEVVRKNLAYVTWDFHQRLKKSQIRGGDVLISRVITDEVRAAVAPEDLNGANCANIIVVRPNDGLMSCTVLGYLGRTETQRQLIGRRVGSAQGVVNTTVLKELSIPMYSLDRQRTLNARVNAVLAQRAAQRHAVNADDDLFASLQARAFRGEL